MGLINNGMQQPMPKQAPKQPAQAAQPADNTSDYRRVLLAASKIIYEPSTMKNLLGLIRKAQSPEVGLAQATILVMAKLAEASKNQIPQAVRTPAAKAVMALIAELAEKAGIIKNARQAVKAAAQMIGQAIMKAANIDPARAKPGAAQPRQGQPPIAAQPQQPMQPQMGAM